MYLFCCTAGPGVTLCFPEKPDSLPHGERFRSWGNCPALPSSTFSWAFNLFIKLWLMAPRDTEGCTFRPSFRLLEEVQGKTSYSYSMPRKFNCSSFSFRVQGWRGASAASCFGLIEVKPPKHVGWFGNVATNAAPWGGGGWGQAWAGQFAYSLLQTVGSESAVNGMGMMFLYQIISWKKKHFQLQTYLRLSSRVCFVSVSELKRQGRGECFWLGTFHLKACLTMICTEKGVLFRPSFRSPACKYGVSSRTLEA